MEAQAPVPPNPGQVVDDPLAPLRLQPLEQISDFWKRYDRLADIHDKTLTSNLNGNLDVLLIFAALFSAINTVFISITMPDLSPSPSEETNTLLRLLVMRADNNTLAPADLSPPFSPSSTSIVVNCLLYASLSCSLLAAVGAMMAKEWLQSFNRSGQTGPLEDQGKFRQSKFNGVEQWHLEAVIKFLPNLLLLSVILFFAGIALFLFPINTVVAGTVIAFSGLGVILSGVAVVAGAISPLCPYQSAASNAVRRISGVLFRLWMLLWRRIVYPVFRAISTQGSKISDPIVRLWMRAPRLGYRSAVNQGISSETLSVSSMDSPAHSHDIPFRINEPPIHRALAPLARVISLGGKVLNSIFTFRARHHNVLARMGSWNQHRVAHFSDTRQNVQASEQTVIAQSACWLLQTTSNHGDQVAAAQFIRSLTRDACTLVLEDSKAWRRLFFLTCEAVDVFDSQPSEGNRELAEAFGLALCHVPLPFPEDGFTGDKETIFDSMPPQNASGLRVAFLQALKLARAKYEKEDGERIFHLAFLFTLLSEDRMIKEYQWANLSKLFLVDENPSPRIADNLLGMWAYSAYRISGGTVYNIRKSEKLMEVGENAELFTETLSWAIHWSVDGLQSVQGQSQLERNAARAYFACLRRARELARQSSKGVPFMAVDGVVELVREYLDPMTARDSGQTPIELVQLSKEAILALRDFIDTKASENGFGIGGISESEHLLDHHLITVVADILLDDPGISIHHAWVLGAVKPSIIKILLWGLKNMSDISMSSRERRRLFLSSCRLWAPLEQQVEFSRSAGEAGPSDKPLTPNDLKRITEFIDYIRKYRNNSAFISRNADVGINRLVVHLDQRVDWEYELFDFYEPRRLCCRSSYIRSDMLY